MGCRSSSAAKESLIEAQDGEADCSNGASSSAQPQPADSSSSAKPKKKLTKQLTVTDLERKASPEGLISSELEDPDEDGTQEPRGSFQVVAPTTGKRKLLQRSFSMSSEVDKKEKRRVSEEKAYEKSGEDDPSDHGIFITCRRGAKDRSLPNQDAWSVLRTATHAIYGVYDGHGRKGHVISNYVKQHLPGLIENDNRFRLGREGLHSLLLDAFEEMENLIDTANTDGEIDATRSGTTCTIIVHDFSEKKLTVAHIGDSGACISRGEEENSTVYMTPDHTPDKPEETKRIEASGGSVVFDGNSHRVYKVGEHYPALNMSRAFGDIRGRDAGIISVPEISEVQLLPTDASFMLCSDGVWEFITPDEACSICRTSLAMKGNPAKDLATESLLQWRENAGGVVDDITVVFADLQHNTRRPNSLDVEKVSETDELFFVEAGPPTPTTLNIPPSHCTHERAGRSKIKNGFFPGLSK